MMKKYWLWPCSLLWLTAGCGGEPAGSPPEPGSGSASVLGCGADDIGSGGLDVIATAGVRPRFVDLVFDPSKFIETCQELEVTVTVADPDPSRLTYHFTVEAPGGQTPTVEQQGATLRFSSELPGDFQALVEICPPPPASGPDCARLAFPIHVVPGADADHDGTADLCEETCVPACGTLTCGPDPVCGASCGTCPVGQICIPLGFCVIPSPH